ncbi:MOSC domain-containing protein [Phaeovulum sp.]|uniref:MOSC domain-containing protein n=1 Tax=Phaeovulum sp. TaxID=2934796 RepID=UPI0039E68D96
MTLTTTIGALFIGQAETHWVGRPASAIVKHPVTTRLEITPTGIVGDAQADLTFHGGPEKAIHHYAAEHYPKWQTELGRSDLFPGRFGENISTLGMTEDTLCIGDILTLGTATVQISQGRQPCWKLNAHMGDNKMAFRFQNTGRTGWYYRVLTIGHVAPGDLIEVVERPCPQWSVRLVTQARLTRRIAPEKAAELAELTQLAPSWRKAFARFAQGVADEDTAPRLSGT